MLCQWLNDVDDVNQYSKLKMTGWTFYVYQFDPGIFIVAKMLVFHNILLFDGSAGLWQYYRIRVIKWVTAGAQT